MVVRKMNLLHYFHDMIDVEGNMRLQQRSSAQKKAGVTQTIRLGY